MDDLTNKTVLVYDHGAFFHVTQRLARDFNRVLFFKPWKKSNPVFMDMVVGDGFDNIERVGDFFSVINEVDLFVFPGLYDGDLQLHLESLGKRVWGSRMGEKYEFLRNFFKKSLKEAGLPVSNYESIKGMTRLRDFLKANDNVFVKVSRFRGDGETWGHINWKLSESKLDAMSFYYGPFKEDILFTVEYSIDTDIEAAYDGYCVDGHFPQLGIHGYEIKDRAYIATLQPMDEMPEQVRVVNELFAPKLAEVRYRSMWGTEIRNEFFIDATCRTPHPPGAIECEMFENYSQILWHGAAGELDQITPASKFAAEVLITSSISEFRFQALEIPAETEKWVKLFSPSKLEGITYVAPEQRHPLSEQSNELGSVVGLGDTIEDAVKTVMEHCADVKGMGITCHTEALADALTEIKSVEDAGMKFADQTIPDPSIVLEEK